MAYSKIRQAYLREAKLKGKHTKREWEALKIFLIISVSFVVGLIKNG